MVNFETVFSHPVCACAVYVWCHGQIVLNNLWHLRVRLQFCTGIFIVDRHAYKEGKKERPPFAPEEKRQPSQVEEKQPIPQELLCLLCKDLIKDAVLIPCCGNSYCDDCKRLEQTEQSLAKMLRYWQCLILSVNFKPKNPVCVSREIWPKDKLSNASD